VEIICILLFIYWIVLLVRVISSFFPIPFSGPVRQIMDIVYAITEPVMRPLRNMIPPIRMGAIALDLSPIIIFIVIAVLRQVLCTPEVST
jgi:YggT family protein